MIGDEIRGSLYIKQEGVEMIRGELRWQRDADREGSHQCSLPSPTVGKGTPQTLVLS